VLENLNEPVTVVGLEQVDKLVHYDILQQILGFLH
jgi:hypothetical protein